MVPDLVQLGSRSGKKAECHEIHAGWLGSGLGSTWFHLVPEVAEKQHPTSRWLAGRLEKCIFLLKVFIKVAHLRGFRVGGPSGRLAGRLEKCIFLLKVFIKVAHLRGFRVGGALPGGWPAASKSAFFF